MIDEFFSQCDKYTRKNKIRVLPNMSRKKSLDIQMSGTHYKVRMISHVEMKMDCRMNTRRFRLDGLSWDWVYNFCWN